MTAGYVRLSRDDDRRCYSSIENQKLIITQYAAGQNLTIDRWYEDDGVSGYIFDRPGFNRLMADLETDITMVFVKDFSRLGRHNAKILLLLDEFRERGRRLVVIDDHYDSKLSEDDTIGITTWFNERYVKDTSRKIRRALGARQKDGSLKTQPPFGYRRTGSNQESLEIVPGEAECVQLIYHLYLQGLGYRKISGHLTQQGILTPSMARRQHALAKGQNPGHPAVFAWSDSMVKNILENDFYAGTLRLRKRARNIVHGKDKRVPKEEQFVFENHHPPIIEPMTFQLVQELKEKRIKSKYRGSRGQWKSPGRMPSLFGSCLFCRDCGSRLTPIERRSCAGVRRYYICSAYNTKGKRGCFKSHLIEEQDLMQDIINYICMCQDMLSGTPASYDMEELRWKNKNSGRTCGDILADMQNEIHAAKKQLKTLLAQKIKELSSSPDNESLIQESFDSIQQDITARIQLLEARYDELLKETKKAEAIKTGIENTDTEKADIEKTGMEKTGTEKTDMKKTGMEITANFGRPLTATAVLDDIIQKRSLQRKDIEILIERIDVDAYGFPEIMLRHCLHSHPSASCSQTFIQQNAIPDNAFNQQGISPGQILNQQEHAVLLACIRLLSESGRDFTSANYLAEHLTKLGYPKSKKSVLPYVNLMAALEIISPCDSSRKPYTVLKSKEELEELLKEPDFLKQESVLPVVQM